MSIPPLTWAAALRKKLLRRRNKHELVFGIPAASVKANRNLLYLANQGVIAHQPHSARVAHELTSDNIAKEYRRGNVQFARESKEAIGAIANAKCAERDFWLETNNRLRRLNLW